MAFLGHLDDVNLIAGVGMGNVCMGFMGFMGMTIISGLNRALDTLISQAYGAKNYELCGIYLNRARFVTTVLFIPIIFISMNVGNALVYLG